MCFPLLLYTLSKSSSNTILSHYNAVYVSKRCYSCNLLNEKTFSAILRSEEFVCLWCSFHFWALLSIFNHTSMITLSSFLLPPLFRFLLFSAFHANEKSSLRVFILAFGGCRSQSYKVCHRLIQTKQDDYFLNKLHFFEAAGEISKKCLKPKPSLACPKLWNNALFQTFFLCKLSGFFLLRLGHFI